MPGEFARERQHLKLQWVTTEYTQEEAEVFGSLCYGGANSTYEYHQEISNRETIQKTNQKSQ